MEDDGTMRGLAGRARGARPPEPLGEIVVPLDGETFQRRVVDGQRREDLELAWREYLKRWPRYRRRLVGRYHRLRAGAAADLSGVTAAALGNEASEAEAEAVTRELLGEPARRGSPKVGRNAPCPCGSGKKYKKCCEGRDSSA